MFLPLSANIKGLFLRVKCQKAATIKTARVANTVSRWCYGAGKPLGAGMRQQMSLSVNTNICFLSFQRQAEMSRPVLAPPPATFMMGHYHRFLTSADVSIIYYDVLQHAETSQSYSFYKYIPLFKRLSPHLSHFDLLQLFFPQCVLTASHARH